VLDNSTLLNPETPTFPQELQRAGVVIIDNAGLRSEWPFRKTRKAFCIFEYVYFARPDSIISGENVGKVRVDMGRELARQAPAAADLVVPVPDSGIYAALGFAEELGIPYYPAFVRNHYIGRTFIQPTQRIRDFNVRVKLNLIGEAVRGKSVVVVDDSIVRGTTSKQIVEMARDAGARKVYFASAAPEVRFPNV